MPWSGRFVDALLEPVIAPRYLLESITVSAAGWRAVGGDLRLSSFPVEGYIEEIGRRGSSVTYGELRPITWERSHGAMSIGLRGERDIRPFTTRGQVVQLRVGFTGWAPDQFEPVFTGQVRNIAYRGGRWVLEVVDLVAALASRFDVTSQQQPLFHALSSTTLTANYTPGVTGTISVGSGAGFNAETGGVYVLRITPTGGDPYYTSATTKPTSNTFSGTLTDGRFNTTASAALAGDTVEAIAYTAAHPIRIAQRLLLSTGEGTGGQYDTLPAGWAWGLDAGLVDADDCDAFYRLSRASGDPNWSMLVDAQQEDAIGWLQGFLQPGGYFVSQHQGLVTCRAVLSTTVDTSTPGSVTIHDDDIVEISGYQAYDPGAPIEYGRSRVRAEYTAATDSWGSTDALVETDIASRPSRDRYTRDLPAVFNGGSAWPTAVSTRIGPWDTRVPERLELTLRGWHRGLFSAGDLVRLNTSLIRPRAYSSGDTYAGYRRALVVGGGIDWFGATTRLVVLTHPDEVEF